MTHPADPELTEWAALIQELRWAGLLLDRHLKLIWVSPDLKRFLDAEVTDDDLGYGLHVVEALSRDAWRRITTPDSRAGFWRDVAPFVAGGLDRAAKERISETVSALLGETEPLSFIKPIATSFEYQEPGSDLPAHRVNVLLAPLRNAAGAMTGVVGLGYMNVRPGLVSLLARGQEDMYERMARLVEPRSHQAAILFCDLHGSTQLARTLPTSEYFSLIRRLWTETDVLVAREKGIIGKHVGDGASAFFLVDQLGSASEAACAAARTARAIHEQAQGIFGDVLDRSCLMRIGIHWGNAVYIGQLVPGGRLDVTALGDPVNECARIEESAEPHQTVASKALIEQLSADDAARLGIEPGKIRYRLLADNPNVRGKAALFAGSIPVAVLPV